MTLRSRRITQLVIIVVNLLLAAASSSALFILSLPSPFSLTQLLTNLLHNLETLPGLGFAVLSAATASGITIVLYRLFRRSSLPELFLVAIATGSLGFEAVRAMYAAFSRLQLPLVYYETVARTLLFFQLAGIIGLFFVSLYLLGIQYQKTNNILAAQFGSALVFTYFFPVSTTSTQLLINQPVDHSYGYTILLSGIVLLSLVNLTVAWVQQKNMESWRLNVGFMLMVVGRLAIIVVPGVGRLTGLILYCIGITLFATDQYNRFLWN